MSTNTDTKKPAKADPMSSVPAAYKQPNGKYRPGYDAKHAGEVARRLLAGEKSSILMELPSQKLRDKAANLVGIWQEKAEAKAAKENARAEKKAEADSKREAEALAKHEAAAEKAEKAKAAK